ncbi:MAG: HRDC domain-containing protein, partial [Bifidobacterium sp.]|nr:HRDC domain-containing protein [Bifidobacterium sp.]
VTDIARAISRCVHDVNQHVGSGKIVKVLRGSKAQDLSYLNPESLPSFGMLDEVPEARIRDVLSQMATDGFLTIAEGRLPIVGFGPRAAETVAPEFHYDIKKIKRADARARRTPDVSTPAVGSYVPDDGDEALFQKLRALRLDIARELGKPPYIVFSDKTLRDMVRVKPITDDQFLAVNGVGESKLKQYGERFMAAIREDSGDEA